MIPLRDLNPARTQPVVTWGIIAVNVLAFVAVGGIGGDLDDAARRFGAVASHFTGLEPEPVIVSDGYGRLIQIAPVPRNGAYLLRALTHMFIHGGWLHLLGNMWFLHVFGDNVEDRMGRLRYAAFYLASGLVALGAQIAADPRSGMPMVGASGAVAGALGAYLRLYPHARVLTLIPIGFFPLTVVWPAVVFLGIWIAMQVIHSFAATDQLGGVAWFAHIGGFAFGWLLAGVLARPERARIVVRVDDAPWNDRR